MQINSGNKNSRSNFSSNNSPPQDNDLYKNKMSPNGNGASENSKDVPVKPVNKKFLYSKTMIPKK